MKNVWLFLLTSFPTGLGAAAGSILGGKVGGQWLNSPLIPIASVALVGVGALVASRPRPPARN